MSFSGQYFGRYFGGYFGPIEAGDVVIASLVLAEIMAYSAMDGAVSALTAVNATISDYPATTGGPNLYTATDAAVDAYSATDATLETEPAMTGTPNANRWVQ